MKTKLAYKRQGTEILTRVRKGVYLWVHPSGEMYTIRQIKPNGVWICGPESEPNQVERATLTDIRWFIRESLLLYVPTC